MNITQEGSVKFKNQQGLGQIAHMTTSVSSAPMNTDKRRSHINIVALGHIDCFRPRESNTPFRINGNKVGGQLSLKKSCLKRQ